MSFGNGPAKRHHDKTGSPISDGKCMNCHSAGKYGVSLDIKMYEGGNEVSEYIPGKRYTFKYRIKHVGNPAKYGFQTTFLDSANTSAGKFDSIVSGFQISTLNEVDYMEHSSPRPVEFMNFDWIAPQKNIGDITIYFGGIAANGNGGKSGDGGAVTSMVIKPAASSGSKTTLICNNLFFLRNNPVNNILTLDFHDNPHKCTGRIYSNSGRIIKTFNIDSNYDNINIDCSGLKSGLYFVSVKSENQYLSKKFIKI